VSWIRAVCTMVTRDGMGRHGRSEDLCGTEIEIVVRRLKVSYTVQGCGLDCISRVQVGRGVGGDCGSWCFGVSDIEES